MVVGETQILAQVKDAYRIALENGVTGRVMNPLFQKAFNVAKAVHTQTKLSEGKLSVSSVAVDLAGKVFRDLSERTVLVLGAGETGELAARCFRDRGVTRVAIANRSPERAAAVAAALGASTVPLDALGRAIGEADVLLACASADHPVVTAGMLREAMARRGGRPMFVVDISVPRIVEPAAEGIPDLYLFNIDDLQSIVDRNLAARRSRMEAGARIVADEARAYAARLPGGPA
jgi:glutamyl-tRNA reductase